MSSAQVCIRFLDKVRVENKISVGAGCMYVTVSFLEAELIAIEVKARGLYNPLSLPGFQQPRLIQISLFQGYPI